MLSSAKKLKGYTLRCRDGEIGNVKEFYFDDHHWAIRYLVAGTGEWLDERQVLISPYSLIAFNHEYKHISVDLTKKQIEDSPSLDTDKPVSRHFEQSFYGYYGFPDYWAGPYMWGSSPSLKPDRAQWKSPAENGKSGDPHLRSTDDVDGHHIQALDGEIGHVEDFLVDDESWAIRYLIINTRNWWPGNKVLISPRWIERIGWTECKVFVNLQRGNIKNAPPYTMQSVLIRDYEDSLHRHYERSGYWDDQPLAKVRSLK